LVPSHPSPSRVLPTGPSPAPYAVQRFHCQVSAWHARARRESAKRPPPPPRPSHSRLPLRARPPSPSSPSIPRPLTPLPPLHPSGARLRGRVLSR
jgi:hypothetical protein